MKLIKNINDLRIGSIIYAVFKNNEKIDYYEKVLDIRPKKGIYISKILSSSLDTDWWEFNTYVIYELDDKDILELVSDAI